jgi:hypothetical protein
MRINTPGSQDAPWDQLKKNRQYVSDRWVYLSETARLKGGGLPVHQDAGQSAAEGQHEKPDGFHQVIDRM